MATVTEDKQECCTIQRINYQPNFLKGEIESVIDDLGHGRINCDCDVKQPKSLYIQVNKAFKN